MKCIQTRTVSWSSRPARICWQLSHLGQVGKQISGGVKSSVARTVTNAGKIGSAGAVWVDRRRRDLLRCLDLLLSSSSTSLCWFCGLCSWPWELLKDVWLLLLSGVRKQQLLTSSVVVYTVVALVSWVKTSDKSSHFFLSKVQEFFRRWTACRGTLVVPRWPFWIGGGMDLRLGVYLRPLVGVAWQCDWVWPMVSINSFGIEQLFTSLGYCAEVLWETAEQNVANRMKKAMLRTDSVAKLWEVLRHPHSNGPEAR